MKSRYLSESFNHAIRGIIQSLKTERNVGIHFSMALLVLVMGLVLKVSLTEWAILIVAIGFVIVSEMLNTAIEYTVDMVCGDTYNELAKYSKDIAAGATLIAALTSAVVGLIIFTPKLIALL